MKFLRKLGAFVKNHWALTAAILLATAAALAVAAIIIFFPPALPAIIAFTGVTIAGFAPFAFLANMSVLAAAATLGAITSGVVLAGSTVAYNVVAGVGSWLKNLFAKDDSHSEIEFEQTQGSEPTVTGQTGTGRSSSSLFSPAAAPSTTFHSQDESDDDIQQDGLTNR